MTNEYGVFKFSADGDTYDTFQDFKAAPKEVQPPLFKDSALEEAGQIYCLINTREEEEEEMDIKVIISFSQRRTKAAFDDNAAAAVVAIAAACVSSNSISKEYYNAANIMIVT